MTTKTPSVTQWTTPPECQGQMVEYSYGIDEDGYRWERMVDKSDRSVSYRPLGHATDGGTWEPWNMRPAAAL